MEQSFIIEDGVMKRVVHAGRGDLAHFQYGSKLFFHYLTKLQDEEGTVLDDSKKFGKPMEIIIGKKFKFEVWEKCLKSMRVNEVAEFKASRNHCASYPAVAKTLRDFYKGDHDHDQHHQATSCCAGAMLQSAEGLGYEDLNSLMKEPKPLIFIFELVTVSQPDEYEKEIWQMDENEQEKAVPALRESGNLLFKVKKYQEASVKYGEALSILDNCAMKEKPHSADWDAVEDAKIPLLLNFAQCHLALGNYRLVIQHTSTVIQRDNTNVKGYYRRGKAHGFIWEIKEAKEDLLKVKQLDPSLSNLVDKDILFFENRIREKEREEKLSFSGKLFTN